MPEEAVFGPLRLLKISDLENKASRECTRSLGCTAAEASLLQRKRKAATPSGGSRELELETARRPGRLLRVGAGRGTDSGAMRMLMLEDFAELDSVKGLQGSIRRTLVLIRVRHQRRAVARQQAAIVIQQLARCVDARTAASCRRELLACAWAAQCIQRAFQCKKSRALVSALRQAQIEKKEKEKIRSEDSVEGVEGGGRGGAAARGDGGACGISEDRVEYDATESMAADIGNARQGIGKSWKSQGSYAVGKRSIVLLQQADVSQLFQIARRFHAKVIEPSQPEHPADADANSQHGDPATVQGASMGISADNDERDQHPETMQTNASVAVSVINAPGPSAAESSREAEEAAVRRMMEELDDKLDAVEHSRHMLQRDILLGTRIPDLLRAQAQARIRERAKARAIVRQSQQEEDSRERSGLDGSKQDCVSGYVEETGLSVEQGEQGALTRSIATPRYRAFRQHVEALAASRGKGHGGQKRMTGMGDV